MDVLISVAILCGGKSSRFGEDKIFYKINGKPLFKIVYEKFEDLTDDIFLQGMAVKENGGILCYRDTIKDKGPLGGIYSALMNAKHNKVFVMAADMPDVDPRIFTEMMEYDNYNVIVPAWRSGHYEPLCAIYSKELISTVRRMLDQDVLKVSKLYEFIANVRYINIDELIRDGKLAENCFTNINMMRNLNLSQISDEIKGITSNNVAV